MNCFCGLKISAWDLHRTGRLGDTVGELCGGCLAWCHDPDGVALLGEDGYYITQPVHAVFTALRGAAHENYLAGCRPRQSSNEPVEFFEDETPSSEWYFSQDTYRRLAGLASLITDAVRLGATMTEINAALGAVGPRAAAILSDHARLSHLKRDNKEAPCR